MHKDFGKTDGISYQSDTICWVKKLSMWALHLNIGVIRHFNTKNERKERKIKDIKKRILKKIAPRIQANLIDYLIDWLVSIDGNKLGST